MVSDALINETTACQYVTVIITGIYYSRCDVETYELQSASVISLISQKYSYVGKNCNILPFKRDIFQRQS